MRSLLVLAAASAAMASIPFVANKERYQRLINAGANNTEPQQLHSSFGEDPTSTLRFVWSTNAATPSAEVRFGVSGGPLSHSASGTSTFFNQPSQYIHHVNLSGLVANTAYDYVVGSSVGGWSNLSTITTVPKTGSAEADDFVFAVYGDMGLANERSLPRLIDDVDSGRINAVLHVGDFAYNLDSAGGEFGNAFLNSIAPIASRVQYQVCPGNHEAANDFESYRARFWMHGSTDSIYHSFSVGNVHVAMISSEVYFYDGAHSAAMLPGQFAWLEQDLASVDRSVHPWTVLMLHRPFYCDKNDDNDDCHQATSKVRDGILGKFAMEPLLMKYGVDLVVAAHEHAYSRTYPLYSFNSSRKGVTNQTDGTTVYSNPTMPVHIISGAAGCPENQDPWQPVQASWDAARFNVYGYGYLAFPNASTATWSFLDDSDGSIVDTVVFKQDNHGPFPMPSL